MEPLLIGIRGSHLYLSVSCTHTCMCICILYHFTIYINFTIVQMSSKILYYLIHFIWTFNSHNAVILFYTLDKKIIIMRFFFKFIHFNFHKTRTWTHICVFQTPLFLVCFCFSLFLNRSSIGIMLTDWHKRNIIIIILKYKILQIWSSCDIPSLECPFFFIYPSWVSSNKSLTFYLHIQLLILPNLKKSDDFWKSGDESTEEKNEKISIICCL